MRLRSVRLRNIRSYAEAAVEFPDGITLLSGDIGAGKSTLLLAVEFGLFGISRTDLSGTALLRHGASDGSVSVTFEIDGREHTITRTLRRGPSGVLQESGWLESAHGREVLTPVELRAKVFSLLGYPLQFLAKQRNILFRFTIYTPQEEMKAVLTQTSDERVETVRRIFGVEAYRVARDNARLVAKALREREQVRESVLSRIALERDRTRERLVNEGELAAQKAQLIRERDALAARVKDLEARTERQEEARAAVQQERQALAMRQRSIGVARQELQQMLDHERRKAAALQTEEKLLEQLRSTASLMAQELGAADIAALRSGHERALAELEALKLKEGKYATLRAQCEHGIDIRAGATCPTCKQRVSAEHLDAVRAELAAQKGAAEKQLVRVAAQTAVVRQRITSAQSTIERARQHAEVQEKIARHEHLAREASAETAFLRETIAAKEAQIREWSATPLDATVEERARKAEQALLELRSTLTRERSQLVEVERRLAKIEQEEQSLVQARALLARLEAERAEHQARLSSDAALQSWLSRQFSPFTATLEQYMLAAIHQHFDSVFREWFGKLMEDDAMTARIDPEFSPLVQQSGYETDTAHLSGGERTAVSLAWRLALVHTIHALVPNLGTAGLIILDEPTDGFSSEQLERVRDVLREIAMDQVIVVSHEQQLEGFVDHILRVRKTAGGSVVEPVA